MLGTLSCRNIRHDMFPSARSAAIALLALAAPSLAQVPSEPAGLKVLESRFGDGVKITYKEVGSHWKKIVLYYSQII